MKLYKDKELTEEEEVLDLGIVTAGDSKTYTYYLKNDTKQDLTDLKFSIPHSEVEILRSPEKIEAWGVAEIVIKWSPSITLKKALLTELNIKGFEIYKL